jgi:hypothetical protein
LRRVPIISLPQKWTRAGGQDKGQEELAVPQEESQHDLHGKCQVSGNANSLHRANRSNDFPDGFSWKGREWVEFLIDFGGLVGGMWCWRGRSWRESRKHGKKFEYFRVFATDFACFYDRLKVSMSVWYFWEDSEEVLKFWTSIVDDSCLKNGKIIEKSEENCSNFLSDLQDLSLILQDLFSVSTILHHSSSFSNIPWQFSIILITLNHSSSPTDLRQEGIFRKTGSVSRQQELKFLVNQLKPLNLEEFTCHDVASVMKSILADLPEPLLTEVWSN